jgi:putative endonuclease
MLRWRSRERLFEPTSRGCSSVVEHLLAKEDVASSSLVTRSSLCLVGSAKRRLERARRSRGEGGPPNRIQATAGKPARDFAVVYYVYILQSKSAPNQRYIGLTRDLKKRLVDHKDGRSPHTAKFAPWLMVAYLTFVAEDTAVAFERYLKSGSGRAFAKRHLWPNKVSDF